MKEKDRFLLCLSQDAIETVQFTADELRAITATCTQMGNKMSSLPFLREAMLVTSLQLRHMHTRMRPSYTLLTME